VTTKLLLPAVTAARQYVSITEEVFRTHTFHGAPRDFFLWTALDEVLKTGVFLMKLDGFLDAEEPQRTPPDQARPTERAIEAILLEEERLRTRRLCELLVQLTLFSQKDDPALYGHFLLLEELVGAHAFNEDLNEFHGAPSEWVRATVEMTEAAIQRIEPQIETSDAWYAGSYKRPARASEGRRLLSSARQRLIRALPLMTDFERLAVGTTYLEAFGGPSGTIHFRPGVDPIDHSTKSTVVAEGTKIGILALCAVLRIHGLLGRPSVPPFDQLVGAVESNREPSRLLELLNARAQVCVGDFVVARGYFGQIVEERVSRFGYRSLRVDFLVERPLPGLAGDWFRARDVFGVLSKRRLVEGVRSKLSNPSAEVGDDTLREAAVGAWDAGLRDAVRSRTSRPDCPTAR
jgi:hypothetical protein